MIYSVNDFPYDIIKDALVLKPHGNKHNQKEYLDIITAFDIETTNLPNGQNIMYIWQFQYGLDYTVVGRRWEDYFTFLERIRKRLPGKARLVVYVHNLSYEFSYLKGLYFFEKDEVFCTESRKILWCSMFDQIEYRCSYFLTNSSLAQFTKQMRVKDLKQSGLEFDYSKLRYPWTPLSDQEMLYCVNDVRGLVEALYRKLKSTGDTVLTVPLTATGYVRRRCREAMGEYNFRQLKEMLPDEEVYCLLREAYRGGNTHANRYYVGDIVEDVKSMDIVSSYPAVMIQCDYPMSKFYLQPEMEYDEMLDLIYKHHQAVLMRVAFWDIDLKDIMTGCPYLSRDKCRNIVNGVYDNGRILKADYLETTVTDPDWRIIQNMYKWSACNPFRVYAASYKRLPDMLLDVIREYYRKKTELKGVSEDSEDYFIYQLNKEQLNSVYGMTATDPVKDVCEFIADAQAEDLFQMTDRPLEELLKESNRKAFLNYAWGVWVTAHARARLQEAIDLAGNNFVYCDTDSVKYTGDLDLREFNGERIAECYQYNGYAVDRNGEVHYLGVFELDGEYHKFATLGAKKYVYTDLNDKLHITIAGVNKKLGAEELGRIENFKEGFVFYKAGGTESHFNDNINEDIIIDGRKVHISDNIVITNGSYTLGITQEFRDLLDGLVHIKYADRDIAGLYRLKR